MGGYSAITDPNAQKKFLAALMAQATGKPDPSALPPLPLPQIDPGFTATPPDQQKNFDLDKPPTNLGDEQLGIPQGLNAPLKPFDQTPSPRVRDLEDQANAIPATGVTPPSNWKEALLKVALTSLPIALAGRFGGGLPAAAGAAKGTLEGQQTVAKEQLGRRAELIKEAEAQRERDFEAQKQEREFQIQAPYRAAQSEYYRDRGEAALQNKNQAPATQTMVGSDGKPHIMGWNPQTHKFDQDFGVSFEKPTGSQHPDSPEQQFIDEYQQTHKGATVGQALAAYSQTTQKPERPQRQLVIGPDNKVFELTPGATVPEGTKSVSGELGTKPTADEQRRADLAENMNENLNQLEDIVNRRPDLFGPAAGRLTQLRQFVGTSDPDVAKLKAIREYLGMASVGAHAMRNAQHVGTAADAVMAGLLNSPEATKAAIKTARASTATFTKNAANPPRGGAPAPVRPFTQGTPSAADPLGIR